MAICRIKCFYPKPVTVGDLEADPEPSVLRHKELNAVVLAHLYSHLPQAGAKHTNSRPTFQQPMNIAVWPLHTKSILWLPLSCAVPQAEVPQVLFKVQAVTLAGKCKGSSTGWPRSCGGRSSSPTAETSLEQAQNKHSPPAEMSPEQAQPLSRDGPRTSPVSSPSSLPRTAQ